MNNYLQPGDTIAWINNSGADVMSGQVVVMGAVLGVAAVDIADGASGSVQTTGVMLVPKASAADMTQGATVIWDASAGEFDVGTATPASGDISADGSFVFTAAGPGMTQVEICFSGNAGTLTA